MHLLKSRKISWEGTETVTEKTLDVALAVQLGVTSAVTVRQANPIYGVAFDEEGVVLGRKETGNPAQGPNLHLLNSFVERPFDGLVQDPGIFECHIQSRMSHELLQS